MSIIFDKGAEKSGDDPTQAISSEAATSTIPSDGADISQSIPEEISSAYTAMDISSMDSQNSPNAIVTSTNMEMDEYQMLYGTLNDYTAQQIPANDLVTQNIPTPSIQMPDGSVLESGSSYTSISDAKMNPGANNGVETQKYDIEQEKDLHSKRMQELDDLAMLGIDAEDLAAQCI